MGPAIVVLIVLAAIAFVVWDLHPPKPQLPGEEELQKMSERDRDFHELRVKNPPRSRTGILGNNQKRIDQDIRAVQDLVDNLLAL